MTAAFISLLKSRGFEPFDGGISYTRTTPRIRRSGIVWNTHEGETVLGLDIQGRDFHTIKGDEKKIAKIIRRLFHPPKGG
jgi:hypothetical protein